MNYKKIPFSKGYSLYYSNQIENFFDDCTSNINDVISRINSESIKEIFLIPDLRGNAGDRAKTTIRLLKEKGIRCSIISLEKIISNNFDFFHNMGRYLNSKLKISSALFLYSENQSHEVEPFISTFLLSGKNVSITPEQAIFIVSGSETLSGKTEKIREFMDYLNRASSAGSDKNASSERNIENSSGNIGSFKKSPFTIRVKLLTLVSLISGISMLTLIISATNLFREHSETLIQEYNLSLARITGLKVASDLEDLIYRTASFGKSISDRKGNRGSEISGNAFFSDNKSFMYLAIAEKTSENNYKFISSFINYDLLEKMNITNENLEKSHKVILNSFSQADSGATVFENISANFDQPAMALIVPLKNSKLAVAYIETSSFLRSFQSARQSEIFQIFMVNNRGDVLIHSDEKISRAQKNLSAVPIVNGMMKSTVNNGSQKYTHDGMEYLGSFFILNRGNIGVISTAESDRVFEAVYKIQRQNILIMIIVLTLAFVLVYFTAKTLTIPLINLLRATVQLEEGLYDLDIKPTTRDEIGLLTNSFLGMAKGLKEREQMKDIFGKFVNKHIAEKALTGKIELGGIKKQCTILFTDLRNFTGISESMQPDQLVAILNEYFTDMVDCIYRNDGIVDKFIGDAIMAHWGALYNSENDAKSAVTSALEMREALIRYNRNSRDLTRPVLHFGCGINSGPVIAGQIGSDKKLEYTVIGDSVNFASRIEYLNKDFKTDILISDSTKKEVETWFHTVPMEPVTIRGKKDKQLVHAVLGRKEDPDCPQSLEELRKLIDLES